MTTPDNDRWRGLMMFTIERCLRRRPRSEHPELREIAVRSQTSDAARQEVVFMWQFQEKMWEEELAAEGEARGRLVACRANLLAVLEERFGSLPEEVVRRIENTGDVDRLMAAVRQAVHVAAPQDLSL